MMTRVIAAIVVATWMVPALGADPNPCSLLTAKEVSSALGSASSGGKPGKPSVDKELGVKSWNCDYHVGKSVLSIDVFEFTSAAGAAKGMKVMMKEANSLPDGIKLAPAPGVGDQSLWGAAADGAHWVTLKGKYMLTVTLAGELKDPPRFREPMKQLASLALGRLAP